MHFKLIQDRPTICKVVESYGLILSESHLYYHFFAHYAIENHTLGCIDKVFKTPYKWPAGIVQRWRKREN